VVKTAETVAVPADPGYAMGAAQVLLLIAGILVFAIVAYVGTMIARGLLAPLGQLEKEVDLLSRGKTDVQISALGRTDEIGRIARSMARIQQSLIELARIKSQRIASQQASLVSNLKQVWLDIREAFRNAFHILGSDAKMIGQHLRSWGSTPSAGATRA
jgi:HAMP domain-containing protein